MNYDERISVLGKQAEESGGILNEDVQDNSGEHPRLDRLGGVNVNPAELGLRAREAEAGGSVDGWDLDPPRPAPSVSPRNRTMETPGGHVVEYDDTPGNERILVRHKSGAAIEMRSDGGTITTTPSNRVETIGGDNTIIVGGDARISTDGNMELKVGGDLTIEAGGRVSIKSGDDIAVQARRNLEAAAGDSARLQAEGDASAIVGNDFGRYVDGEVIEAAGSLLVLAEESAEIHASGDFAASSGKNATLTGVNASVAAADILTAWGRRGSIGGGKVDYTGRAYQGPGGPLAFSSGAAFYGSFHGQATEAMFSRTAWSAQHSKTAEKAGEASVAAFAHGANSAKQAPNPLAVPPTANPPASEFQVPDGGAPQVAFRQELSAPEGPPVSPALIDLRVIEAARAAVGTAAVIVEPVNPPSGDIGIDEARAILRSRSAAEHDGVSLAVKGTISGHFASDAPGGVGRIAPEKSTVRYGARKLGNTLAHLFGRFRGND